MLDKLRREFLVIMGESYDQYGYPSYCGWIEGLLLLETRVWTQKDISEHLHRLFPESKYPTSVPSVNRALKLLETYGVVEKSGSRKIGYKYRLMPSSSLIVTMLQMFMAVNQNFLKKLEDLSSQNIEDDPELKNAITYQVNGAKLWGELIEKLLKSVSGTEDR
jgi:DNA-binding transcriptional regulator GbsR (MarR family)